MWNGNSTYGNGASVCLGMDDAQVLSLPWPFRVFVPGYVGGWPG